MGSIGNGLIIMLTIQAMLMLGQASVLELNPAASIFYDGDGTMLESFDEGNYTLTTADPLADLPGGSDGVGETDGNIFTDIFQTVKNWVLDTTGAQYVLDLLSAPTTLLNTIGLPAIFAFALGAIWYGTMLFYIISWIFGRTDN